MRGSLLLTVPPDCQGESDVGEKQARHSGIHFDGNGDAVGLEFLPDAQNVLGAFVRTIQINLQLGHEFLKGTCCEGVENLAVRDFQGFAGGVGAEAGGQAIVMIGPGVVVASGGQVDQSG